MVSVAHSILVNKPPLLLDPKVLFDMIQLGSIISDVSRELHLSFKSTWLPVLTAQLRSIVAERSSWMVTWYTYNPQLVVPAVALVSYKY